jgi:etoposide-induced 2.4 mRNA
MDLVQRFLRHLTAGDCRRFNIYTALLILQYYRMLTALAGSAYRVVMIVTSLILTNTLSYVPIIGSFVGFAFLCWVNA